MTKTEGAYVIRIRNSPFAYLSLLLKSFEKRSNYLEIVWILLDAKHLNNFKELLQ